MRRLSALVEVDFEKRIYLFAEHHEGKPDYQATVCHLTEKLAE